MQQEAIVSMQKQIDELKQHNLELRQKVEGKVMQSSSNQRRGSISSSNQRRGSTSSRQTHQYRPVDKEKQKAATNPPPTYASVVRNSSSSNGKQDGKDSKDPEGKSPERFSHSKALLIYGVRCSKHDLNASWLQHFFADSGIIESNMEIESVKLIENVREPFLKVFFKNESDVKKIIQRKWQLRNVKGFEWVYINESKPRHQRIREAQERRRSRFDHRQSSYRGRASRYDTHDPYHSYDHDPYYPYDRPGVSSSFSHRRRDYHQPLNWRPPRSSRWDY